MPTPVTSRSPVTRPLRENRDATAPIRDLLTPGTTDSARRIRKTIEIATATLRSSLRWRPSLAPSNSTLPEVPPSSGGNLARAERGARLPQPLSHDAEC